jgi:prephenate dehydrogenase
VDEILPLQEAIVKSDLIILAIPVNAAEKVLPSLLDQIHLQVVMDVGSTKEGL